MRHILLIAAVLGGIAAAVACSSSGTEALSEDGADGGDEGGNSVVLGPDNKPVPTGPAGTGLATGLPCDVQAVIENRCIACHDGKMAGVPKMLDYADLLQPSKLDGLKSIAVLSVERMKSTTSPMPPPPAEKPDADEIQVFADWVKAGTPKNAMACTEAPPTGDGGADAGPLPDAGPDAAAGCASGVTWKDGNKKSPLMHPGLACNACHSVMGGPNLSIAGTAYKAPHDVDDCNGAAPPPTVTVTITDAKGKVVNATVNAAGNFFVPRQQGAQRLTAPFSAKLSDGVKTRIMNGKVTSGDCNSCHTTAGKNGAPGRILVP
jgi:mono/diheme cytochrome c family protein